MRFQSSKTWRTFFCKKGSPDFTSSIANYPFTITAQLAGNTMVFSGYLFGRIINEDAVSKVIKEGTVLERQREGCQTKRRESGGYQSTMKRAGAYKREKKIYLNPSSKTTMGLWIGTSPRIIFDETDPPSTKGKYIRESLRHSQEGVPHPTDWENRMHSFLKEVGAKSWSKFAKTALSCTIELEGDQLAFLPYRNSGPEDNYNFIPINDRKLTISIDASDEELGLLLEKAFEACE